MILLKILMTHLPDTKFVFIFISKELLSEGKMHLFVFIFDQLCNEFITSSGKQLLFFYVCFCVRFPPLFSPLCLCAAHAVKKNTKPLL